MFFFILLTYSFHISMFFFIIFSILTGAISILPIIIQFQKNRMSNNSLRNYEIKQKLGSGSYGVIYKAYNKIDKSICVLKQISLSRMSEKARKNAANEAHIMGKLKHPFIVCYYESFVEDNNLNILMEFCDSGDLCYYLKQQNKKFLKQEKIWKFFIQICMGLEHIHKNKILHRDIKTLNIFLNKNQTVKIGDLGVAKMLNSNDFAHTMVGTPFYLSPELCQEKPYNQKSDIWALGCLLYQLCTFRHPFEAANQASLILKIIRGKYEPIPQFYSKQLRQMITMCLQRDYKRRPTANMILSKPYIKKFIEDFQLNKIVDQFYIKLAPQPPPKPEVKIIDNKPPITKIQNKIPQPQAEKPRKVLDQGVPTARQQIKPDQPKIQIKQLAKQQKKQKKVEVSQPDSAMMNRRRESQPALRADKQDQPKILFGSQNKADFISALQHKLRSPPKKVAQQRQQIPKRAAISFEIPWKGESQKKVQSETNQPQGKIVIHNKNAILSEPELQQKNSEIIQRVKMDKKIEPKVYEIGKPADRPPPIIKSGGFSQQQQQQRPQTCLERKKIQQQIKTDKKSVENKFHADKIAQQQKIPQKQAINSMKNIRKSSQQRPSYMPKKQSENENQLPHYPPKIKRPGLEQQKSRPPKHLPHHQSKSTSASRFTEVTKEEQDLVANLPDIVKKENEDSESDGEKKAKTSTKLKFKQIDDNMVVKMYEQMMDSKRLAKSHPVEQVALETQETNGQNIQQMIPESSELYNYEDEEEEQQNGIQQQEQANNSEIYYQVNKYKSEEAYQSQDPFPQKQANEWQYDQQPELPMLQQAQTPLFEQANPYLVQQDEQTETKTEQQILEDKKQHLQIKLKQNMKREDQINKLMQMKIQQCKQAVPKNFDQILSFFRTKINMDREYTEEDEKEVEVFLARRGLTDQRKFQNIYKIMHFQMQLQNTRRIIQSICKKLSQLQKQKNNL